MLPKNCKEVVAFRYTTEDDAKRICVTTDDGVETMHPSLSEDISIYTIMDYPPDWVWFDKEKMALYISKEITAYFEAYNGWAKTHGKESVSKNNFGGIIEDLTRS
ncbi:MAG TPA: hypothetical protein PKU93_03255 [Candidatus Pacearchaeota archaeon]|nr:hypothetical protein [Candidatus Pacearchaeota archaeon]